MMKKALAPLVAVASATAVLAGDSFVMSPVALASFFDPCNPKGLLGNSMAPEPCGLIEAMELPDHATRDLETLLADPFLADQRALADPAAPVPDAAIGVDEEADDTVSLVAGFDGDPYETAIIAGGPFDAANLGVAGCHGYINPVRPDVRLHYSAGDVALRFFVTSGVDTTLVVRTPDGEVHCNDDESNAGGTAPGIVIAQPADGAYSAWVGVFDRWDTGTHALLGITEGSFPWAGPSDPDSIGIDEPAAYGTVTLTAGFSDDPHETTVRAGGSADASSLLAGECRGYIDAERPDVSLRYAAGNYQVHIYATSDTDTTLVVRTPDGEWRCSDDESAAGGYAPGVVIGYPEDGTYAIWIGTYSQSDAGAVARLGVSERGFPWEFGSTGSATAFFVSPAGHLLTNHHVVDECRRVEIEWSENGPLDAAVIATDAEADLAVLKADVRPRAHAVFRAGKLRQGERVVTFGFPLRGDLSGEGNASVGYIAATRGAGDDEDELQFSAPIQDGSSGSPLADENGNVVGVVKSALGAEDPADPPQLANFAVSRGAIVRLLDDNNVPTEASAARNPLTVPDIVDRLREIAVSVSCI